MLNIVSLNKKHSGAHTARTCSLNDGNDVNCTTMLRYVATSACNAHLCVIGSWDFTVVFYTTQQAHATHVLIGPTHITLLQRDLSESLVMIIAESSQNFHNALSPTHCGLHSTHARILRRNVFM